MCDGKTISAIAAVSIQSCDGCGCEVSADEITKVLVMKDDGVAKLVKLCAQCIAEDSED